MSTAGAPGLSSSRHERTAENRLDAEHVEKVRRHDTGVDAIGLAALQEIEIHLMEFHQAVEVRRLIPVGKELLDRHADVGAAERRRRLTDEDQPIAVSVGQRLEQHAVNDAEDRRIRANPEAQREDGQQREAGTLPQRAHRVSQVVLQLIRHDGPPHPPHVWVTSPRTPKSTRRPALRDIHRGRSRSAGY